MIPDDSPRGYHNNKQSRSGSGDGGMELLIQQPQPTQGKMSYAQVSVTSTLGSIVSSSTGGSNSLVPPAMPHYTVSSVSSNISPSLTITPAPSNYMYNTSSMGMLPSNVIPGVGVGATVRHHQIMSLDDIMAEHEMLEQEETRLERIKQRYTNTRKYQNSTKQNNKPQKNENKNNNNNNNNKASQVVTLTRSVSRGRNRNRGFVLYR